MLKKYFLTGLLVWIPIVVTVAVIKFIINIVNNILNSLPHAYQPNVLIGMHLPGLNLIILLLIIMITGLLTTNYLGKAVVRWGENILAHIPLIRTVYSTVKQSMHALFKPKSHSFRKVMLIEYPRKGLWSIGFLTNTECPFNQKNAKDPLVMVFVPTTPNPTSGVLIAVPTSDTKELSLSIDEALKMIISLGTLMPKKYIS